MPASIYTPGMTIEQFRAKLQADPGFQQLISSAARLPNGQFTPQAGLAISRYAQSKGLNELNVAQVQSGDPHRSTYSIDGNGGILEQHDGKGPEFWGPIIVGAVSGGAIAAPYLGVGAGAEGAAGATTAGGTTAAGTTAALGPSTAGNIAATSGVVGGSSVPSALAVGAGGGSGLATMSAPMGQVISTGIGSTANLYGGKSAANAQKEAAALQAKAISDAAALQKQSADATLAFEKDQADKTRADNITAQNANFGQWGYRQNVIRPYQGTGLQAENTLAQMLGLPAVNTTLPDLPAAPVFSSNGSASAPSGSASSGPAPNVDGSAASISAYFKSKGVSDQETPYWVQQWPALVARGKEIGNPNYATDRLSQADIFGKQTPAAPRTIGSYAGMPPIAPTPAGTGTTLPFIPLNLGGYAGVQA